eukprot:CAMPEP_0181463846 /NCGR_PEP_ID=MMETSP1110-20121109/35124_1 /TAXON_ID=174948 /ORGANISM="Symbiodinium sp., Strain CCMP421" /LENGTH=166 /DNA_ID=CAMNT_0023588555 /DNA_START=56 /DNA_END=553 /DNA_ORIENTATION=-
MFSCSSIAAHELHGKDLTKASKGSRAKLRLILRKSFRSMSWNARWGLDSSSLSEASKAMRGEACSVSSRSASLFWICGHKRVLISSSCIVCMIKAGIGPTSPAACNAYHGSSSSWRQQDTLFPSRGAHRAFDKALGVPNSHEKAARGTCRCPPRDLAVAERRQGKP